MTINGGFADLPTLNNVCTSPCGPVNFGNLLAIEMIANLSGAQFTLRDLTQSPDSTAFPMWDIAPDGGLAGIRFIDALDRTDIFDFGWENARIQTDTDFEGGPCFFTGACFVTGHWVAVPEGSSLVLLASGLLGLCCMVLAATRLGA
jgi:hypothetical protein